jgi:hypothetical protein
LSFSQVYNCFEGWEKKIDVMLLCTMMWRISQEKQRSSENSRWNFQRFAIKEGRAKRPELIISSESDFEPETDTIKR